MNAITQATMFKQAGGPVSISSVLIPMDQLKQETIDAIRNAAVLAAVNKAYELWGKGQTLTIRDLNGTDMHYTNNIFTETANAAAGWHASAAGAFTVPTATVVAIYGIAIGWQLNAAVPLPITGIRVDVGGSRQAQWNVQCLSQWATGAIVAPLKPRAGVTRSPIVAAEDITVTTYENSRGTATVYEPCWIGVAVEKEGVTLKP